MTRDHAQQLDRDDVLLSCPWRAVEWAAKMIRSLAGKPNKVEVPINFLGKMGPTSWICVYVPPLAGALFSSIYTLVALRHIPLPHFYLIPGDQGLSSELMRYDSNSSPVKQSIIL